MTGREPKDTLSETCGRLQGGGAEWAVGTWVNVSEMGVTQGKQVLVAIPLLLAVGVLRWASGTFVARRGACFLQLSELERQGPIPWMRELGASISPGFPQGPGRQGLARPGLLFGLLSCPEAQGLTEGDPGQAGPVLPTGWEEAGLSPSALPAHLVFGLSSIAADCLPSWLQTFPGLAFSDSPSDTENFGSQGLFITYTAR